MSRAQRPLAWLTAAAVGLALAQAWGGIGADASAAPALGTGPAHESGSGLFGALLLSLASGRLLLSFLPPGHLGGHGPRELPATLAASHALGQALLLALQAVTGHGSPSHSHDAAYAGLGTGLLLLFVWRWMTLPAALVPRRAPLPEARPPYAELAPLAVLAVATFVNVREPTLSWAFGSPRPVGATTVETTTPLAVIHWLAGVTLVAHALRAAGCRLFGRTWVWLAVALGPWAAAGPTLTLSFLLHAAGVAGSAAWVQRASRRGGALAALGWSGVALVGAPGTAILAAALSCAASARQVRAQVARSMLLVAAAAGVALLLSHSDLHTSGEGLAFAAGGPGDPSLARLGALLGVLTGVLVLSRLGTWQRNTTERATTWAGKRLQEPGVEGVGGGTSVGGVPRENLAWRESTFCQALLACGLALAWIVPASNVGLAGLVDPLGLVPIAGLVAGLALARSPEP